MTEQAKVERFLRLIQLMSGPRDYRIAELCSTLEMSRRTFYRYVETFKDAGFVVEKKDSGVFKIAQMSPHCSNLENLIYFSKEEAYLVNSLIEHLDQTNSLKAGLHRKLSSIYDSTSVRNFVDNQSNALNIDNLSKAIRYKKKTILRNYESGHSRQVRDRLVEPFSFTSNFIGVWAFDLEDDRNKVFKVSRIGETVLLNDPWTAEDRHYEEPSDVFGMSGEPIETIILRMSGLAKNLLIEEHPLAEKDIRQDDGFWILETGMAKVQGAGRFVLGLCEEVEILKGEKLKEYISSVAAQHIIPKFTQSK
ncbi:MAG: WYL domain-containing protein [Bacteroidales bacterium]|nr:WYL domain-containing protein [Candidatus Cryptobacteroides choladohippi]